MHSYYSFPFFEKLGVPLKREKIGMTTPLDSAGAPSDFALDGPFLTCTSYQSMPVLAYAKPIWTA